MNYLEKIQICVVTKRKEKKVKAIACEKCGSNELQRMNGYLVCSYCGAKYLIDNTNKPHHDSSIELGNDIERLLAKCKAEPRKAKKYANLILDIDPTNREAHKYL